MFKAIGQHLKAFFRDLVLAKMFFSGLALERFLLVNSI